MQAPTAEWPGLARPFCCFLKKNLLNTFFLRPFLERVLKQAQMRLFKDLLTPQSARRFLQRVIFAG
jgi:hypothetical protein